MEFPKRPIWALAQTIVALSLSLSLSPFSFSLHHALSRSPCQSSFLSPRLPPSARPGPGRWAGSPSLRKSAAGPPACDSSFQLTEARRQSGLPWRVGALNCPWWYYNACRNELYRFAVGGHFTMVSPLYLILSRLRCFDFFLVGTDHVSPEQCLVLAVTSFMSQDGKVSELQRFSKRCDSSAAHETLIATEASCDQAA